MKLTILGCWGGYPAQNEASSGYLLEHEEFTLLLDCGSGVLSKLQNHTAPANLSAVILTHYHADHVADIGVLQHALLIQGMLGNKQDTLPIYGHKEDEAGFNSLTYKDITKGIAYNPDETLEIGPFSITFLKTRHPAPCFAMRIECEGRSLVYTGDTSYIDELAEFASEADLLLCESNFYHGMDGSKAGHMTSMDAGKLAQGAEVKLLVLTHLPHFGELNKLQEEASQEFDRQIIIARSSMEYYI
ncbi:ribonuclease BN (tRNA processing enzyme) [Peribacillus deserti]|uniref:Ribonuclease BN (tRNA processing enzyme) n=1 Tax=Peribacillus deserti TaxID=673318 RepID=A0ABS2QLH7_9BACI|nr:MBL fold metallo-hydrolase [Peribacillus deserti]MBM7694026.1 ribonuclease BN (tRNA processing enzyme) [Peribacillus deserti]